MQGDPIAFGIDDDRAKAVLADLLSRSQNFSAVCTRRFDGLIKPAFNKKINQRTVSRRVIINATAVAPNAKITGRILFFVRQKSVFRSAVR